MFYSNRKLPMATTRLSLNLEKDFSMATLSCPAHKLKSKVLALEYD